MNRYSIVGFLALLETACGGSSSTDSLPVGTDNTFGTGTSGAEGSATTLAVSVGPYAPVVCPGQCAALTAEASGGTPPYSYVWAAGVEGAGATVRACPSATTTYAVTATDSSGHAGELASSNAAASGHVTVTVSPNCLDGGPSSGSIGPSDGGLALEFTQPTSAAWTGITVGVRQGGMVYWANWTSAGSGTVAGTLALPSGAIQVTYAGDVYGAQTTSGGNPFTPASAYTSATVPDPPTGSGVVELAGGPNTPDTLTFSQPVTDPLVAIVSLGTGWANQTADLVFDAPVTVLSTGTPGYVGNGMLMEIDGGVAGTEAQGVVEVEGTF